MEGGEEAVTRQLKRAWKKGREGGMMERMEEQWGRLAQRVEEGNGQSELESSNTKGTTFCIIYTHRSKSDEMCFMFTVNRYLWL